MNPSTAKRVGLVVLLLAVAPAYMAFQVWSQRRADAAVEAKLAHRDELVFARLDRFEQLAAKNPPTMVADLNALFGSDGACGCSIAQGGVDRCYATWSIRREVTEGDPRTFGNRELTPTWGDIAYEFGVPNPDTVKSGPCSSHLEFLSSKLLRPIFHFSVYRCSTALSSRYSRLPPGRGECERWEDL